MSSSLGRGLGDEWVLRVGAPLTLEKVDSEPEPDFLIVRGALMDYLAGHPGPDDVILAIEVSDTTQRFDRGRKTSVYLRSGPAEYWVVDVRGREVLVHRLAGENGEIERVDAGGTVTVPVPVPVPVPGTGLALRAADFPASAGLTSATAAAAAAAAAR